MDNVLKFLIRLQATEGNVLSVARKTTQTLGEIQRKSGQVRTALHEAFSFSSFRSSLMAVPGMQFLLNPYTMIGAGIGAVAKLGMEAESTSIAFTTLVGSEEKAAQMLQEISAFATATPFGKMELVKNVQQMLNFGVSAEKAMTYLRQLGDISGGNAERFSSLSLVMGQVSASGKLSGQDNLQFINAGFNPLKELEKMTGKTYKELQDMMSKGQISADHVAQAIAHATAEGGAFHGMLGNLSQSSAGMWSTVLGNIQERMAELWTQIQPLFIRLMELVNALIPPVMNIVEVIFSGITAVIGIVDEFGTSLAVLAGAVGVAWAVSNGWTLALGVMTAVQKGVVLATQAWTAVQWLFNAALTANPIGIVIMAIGTLIAVGVYCWEKFAGFRAFLLTMWDVVKGLGGIIKDYLVSRLEELLKGVGLVGEALGKLFSGDFSGAWDTAKQAFSHIVGVDSAMQTGERIAKLTTNSWQKNHAAQTAKQAEKEKSGSTGISTPGLKGSATDTALSFGAGTSKGAGGRGEKTAQAIATGGTRNTSIHIQISKFFDTINVHMMDKTDTADLERIVLQSLNRSLAIATSTDR